MASVLHITSGLGMGGAETMLVQLGTRLQARGHPQHVVSLNGRGDLADALERAGVPVIDLGIRRPLIDAAPGLLRLRATVRRLAPDVIQGWMYHGNVAAMLAHLGVAQPRRRRLFWNLRASNMDEARYGGVIRANAWCSGVPHMVIANSAAGAAFHVAHGFHPRRMEVVANGIDVDRFRPDPGLRARQRSEFGIDPGDIVVIHVARVDAMKDHAMFLEAMAALPQISAILVGPGTEMLRVPRNVHLLGLRKDVERLYPAADIVASSSAFGEGFSNAIAEGMSAGLIPVATDVGDASLIVGDAGAIVPPRNAAAFARALSNLAALTSDERCARGFMARERILRHFAIPRAVEAFERLYLES
jgi:glycosyltransferase involved in cell wall biosynthesis